MTYIKPYFRAAAVCNWLWAAMTLFQKALFIALELEPPEYPSVFIFLGTTVLVLGVLYWDVAEHPEIRPEVLKVGLLDKCGGSVIWIIGLLTKDLPAVFWIHGFWLNFFWVPGFVYFYVRSKRTEKPRFK